MKKQLTVIVSLILTTFVFAQSQNAPEAIWPEGKMQGTTAQEYKLDKRGMVSSLKTPTLEYFLTKSEKPTQLVIVCPGGGYQILAHSHEGTDIAKWLNQNGISAAILRYRVPNNPDGALQDIQRAIRIVRKNADKLNIQSNKIGVIGFSAGANLCARASTNYDKKTYEPVDEIDVVCARPDFTMLIYPAYCDKQGNERRWQKKQKDPNADLNTRYALADELKVTKDTPPVFIAQTLDDKNYIDSSIAYFIAAKSVGVPANLHIFDKGGHGYGLAKNRELLVGEWPKLAADWLKDLSKYEKNAKK